MDTKLLLSMDKEELVESLSFTFFSETEEKQNSFIKEIAKLCSEDLKFSALLKESVVEFFNSLINDEVQVESTVLLGFASLAIEVPSSIYSDVFNKFIKQSFPIVANYDHPLKQAFKKVLYAFVIIAKTDDKMEAFWNNLWLEGFDCWHDVAFLGLQMQNPKLAAKELPTLYKRLTYNSEKILTYSWAHPKVVSAFTAAIKKGIAGKEYWAERLADAIHSKILPSKDAREEFCKETGYKSYNSYGMYGNYGTHGYH